MININKINPLGRLCISLGGIPTSYKESLTYEEQLLWLFNFLDTQVIPNINNNGSAIQELQNLYNELNNYLNSPEFIEEIGKKIDTLVEDGTMQELIKESLGNGVVYTFQTYNDLMNFSLPIGSIAKTLGRNSLNDGGGALYQVTDESVIDGLYTISYDSKTLSRIVTEETNILSFGIEPLQDISNAINLILSKENKLIMNSGTYLINVNTKITPKSNQTIIGNNTIIRINGAYDVDYYAMMNIQNVNNVTINGITFDGVKTNSARTTGTGGHCISIGNNTDNILIENCIFKDSWYDGILVDTYTTTQNDIIIKNCIFNNNDRNGISVTSVYNIDINNCIFENIIGNKSPNAAIDIEPYTATNSIMKNINFHDNYIFNCLKGFQNYLNGLTPTENVNINCYNIRYDGNSADGTRGIYIGYMNAPTGISNQYYNNIIINNSETGIYLEDYNKNGSITMDNIILDNIELYGIHFNNLYNFSYNNGAYHFGKVRILNSSNTDSDVRFETGTTTYVAYKNIRIDDINTSKIANWQYLENSEIHNNQVLTLTTDYTLDFNHYYERYETNYANAKFTLTVPAYQLTAQSLPINIYSIWTNLTVNSTGNMLPSSMTGTGGMSFTDHAFIQFVLVKNRWNLKQVIGTVTPVTA